MTQSLEDYIEAIYVIAKENRSACVRDIAKTLDVKMPSVVKAIHELKRLGLVTQEPYSPVLLTKKGEMLAANVLGRHNLLKKFLEKLGVSSKIADKDACMMEHILSAETLDKIRAWTAGGIAEKAAAKPRETKTEETKKEGRTK